MTVGGVLGRIAPVAGFIAGAAVIGGAATYGAIRVAGEKERDAGMGTQLLGQLGGNPLVGGLLGGMAAWQVAGRIRGGAIMPGPTEWLLLPAGVAGAWVGSKLAHAGLEHKYQEEYDEQLRNIDRTIEDTREMFRSAGASEAVLDRVPERYDRSYFNASYQPALGPFRNDIVVGRHPETGLPFAADDVIAHEFTHKALHEYAPGLLSATGGGDARAIHESIADTFAMVVDDEDWLVGEDAVEGGLRSFSHPEERGAFRDGKAVPGPITRQELEGGGEEHLAAGVGNKVAWRIGDALGRETMAKIYVAALERHDLPRGATFRDLSRSVRLAAVDLYGPTSHEAQIVDDSWRQAGY